jgi:hypothetical protein
MQNPSEGDTLDFVTPTFVCDSVNYANVQYTFEIATSTKFDDASMVHVGTSAKPRYTLPFDLLASRDYYVRATALFNGIEVMTTSTKFRTMAQYVPVPVITWPTNGIDIAGQDLKIVWKKQASSGFQVEISSKSTFPPRSTTYHRIADPEQFYYVATDLEAGTWYIRVLAAAEGGYTEPSKAVQINMGVSGGVNGLDAPVAVENLQISTTPSKILEDGRVYILRNGKRYSILGVYAQ